MVTARGEEDDRILGLAMGADDYVTKPFSARELVLRVESVLRRSSTDVEPDAPSESLDGDLAINVRAHTVTRDGTVVPMTGREFDLLVYLVRHPGIAFSREALMREVWGWEFGDQSTVTVHVRRLRIKVEVDPAEPRRLTTVWGVGYQVGARRGVMSDLGQIVLLSAVTAALVGVVGFSLFRTVARWNTGAATCSPWRLRSPPSPLP